MKKAAFYIVLLFTLIICSCGWDYVPDDSNYYELRGRWKSTGPFFSNGELIIDYSSITIYGFSGNGIPHPLAGFTHGNPLNCYSETVKIINDERKECILYIKDKGEYQAGIPYIYWENNVKGSIQRFITFIIENYDDPDENTLKWVSNE